MKANRFLDLAAASRSPLFAGATRVLMILGLLLLPMFVTSSFDLVSGSTAMAGPPPDKGSGKGDLYSDLVVTYRTEDGLPIFVDIPAGTEEEGEELAFAEGYVACEQPITFPILGDDYLDYYANWFAIDLFTNDYIGNPLLNLADGKEVSPIPLGGTGIAGEECEVAYDPGAEPEYDYTMYPQEVHFGRMNVGRSPDRVLDQQLRDVIGVLADAKPFWDYAGRIKVGDVPIDSPLQNLAIFRELLTYIFLPDPVHGHIQLANLPWTYWDSHNYAAAALGAAADKGEYDVPGVVNLDLVVYNNRILDIPNQTFGWRYLVGDGVEGVLGERYFNFRGFFYDREAKYRGCVEGIKVNGEPFAGRIMDLVFENDDPKDFEGYNVLGFAVAADDSRRVIAYVHDTTDFIVKRIDAAGKANLCAELQID